MYDSVYICIYKHMYDFLQRSFPVSKWSTGCRTCAQTRSSSCICPMVLTTLCLQRIWTSKEFGWWEQPRVWISKIGLYSKMDRKSSKLCKNESKLSGPGTEVGIFISLLEWMYPLVGPLSHNAFCCGSRFWITDSLQESRLAQRVTKCFKEYASKTCLGSRSKISSFWRTSSSRFDSMK